MQNQDVEFIDNVGKNGTLLFTITGRQFTPPSSQTLWLGFQVLESGVCDHRDDDGLSLDDTLMNTLLDKGWSEYYGDDKPKLNVGGYYGYPVPYHIVSTLLTKFDALSETSQSPKTTILQNNVEHLNAVFCEMSKDENSKLLNRLSSVSEEEFGSIMGEIINPKADFEDDHPPTPLSSFDEHLQSLGVEVLVCEKHLQVTTTGLGTLLGYELTSRVQTQAEFLQLTEVFNLFVKGIVEDMVTFEGLPLYEDRTLDNVFFTDNVVKNPIPLPYQLTDESSGVNPCGYYPSTEKVNNIILVSFLRSEDLDNVPNWTIGG